jgi:mannosyltransferase OCH1-like enzyme
VSVIKPNKIPKTIHYCWFGGKEKPPLITRCIESWKQILPDYEIIEWNENNFSIKENLYAKEAFEAGKYAFVSDYVRVFVLYHFGGIYLDTDVEVYKSFNDLLDQESFWGFEQENYIATSTIGAAKWNPLIKKFLDFYENRPFIKEDGSQDSLTNVAFVTTMLNKQGLKLNGEFQKIERMGTFYPQNYFSPYDYINCRLLKTKQTYCMHHFHKSWLPFNARLKSHLKHILAKVIGGNTLYKIRKLLSS